MMNISKLQPLASVELDHTTINKVKNLATAGFEELKERIEDAKAASKVNEQEF